MIKQFIKRHCRFFLKRYSNYYIKKREKRFSKKGIQNSRWYQFAFAECGRNLRISGDPLIQKPELIYIGDNCSINEAVQINPNGKIYIGNNVTLSSGAKIISNTLDTNNWTEKRLSCSVGHVGKDIRIGDGTWICANAIILPGVSILGKGVIVAAGSVVTKDINEDYVVVAGTPAAIVKRIQ